MALSSLAKKTKKLRQVIKLHANWLVYATLGESALTKYEVEELVKYGKLPMDATLDLVDKSYLLGRLKSLVKRSEYKQVTYEEAAEKADKMKLSSLEELVVEQARIKAGNYLKNLANEISNGVFDSLATALGSAITEATVRDLVADETALALIQKKTSQELASSLAARLQTGPKKTWRQVAETELHRAKVSGYAQAIINRVDIYAHSDGPNSNVSIVPSKSCCADCSEHYLDSSGTPKVFKLVDLLSAGSNSDDGVVHTKKNGKHTHWKTTLPPMHPSCGCQLVYVPPGYGWADGKLSLLQKSLFEDSLKKARAGVSGGISPTVKPKGPPQPSEGPKIASQPGAAAPGNVPGPGRPPSTPGVGGGSGGGMSGSGGGGSMKYAACPFGGGEDCIKNGGNGAENHKMSGSIMKRHQEAIAKGAKPKTQQQGQEPHKPSDVLEHLGNGEIVNSKDLSSLGGSQSAFKVDFAGGGSGIMKPTPTFKENSRDIGLIDGANSIPDKTGHISEAAAYSLSMSLGLTDHVAPTTTRESDGSHGIPTGSTSVQQWKDAYSPVDLSTTTTEEAYKSIVSNSKNPEKMHQKLSEIAVLDVVMNNNDRHLGNVMVNSDGTDAVAIDHGFSFGSGLQGHKNHISVIMEAANVPLTVPDHLQTRFTNSSLSDVERSLKDSGLQDWQVMQTYLRQKYVSHLQSSLGYIPAEATRNVKANTAGELFGGLGCPRENREEFVEKLNKNQMLPDQVFASFAKKHILDGVANKDAPGHADFVRMAEAMPLHPPGVAWDSQKIGSEVRKKHWDRIAPYDAEVFESYKSRWGKERPDKLAKQQRSIPNTPSSAKLSRARFTASVRASDNKKLLEEARTEPELRSSGPSFEPLAFAQTEVSKSLYILTTAKFPLDKFGL